MSAGDHGIPPAPRIEGAEHIHSGKVRDLYRLPGGELLMVASDRISAYDFVLESTIPDKGAVLTQMSLWWFERLADLVPNHVLDVEVPAPVAGRAVVCERLEMFPVECVARGYLTGSGLREYDATGEVCGIALPDGLVDGSRLELPIFTPATKAELGDHDENVSYEAVVAVVGPGEASRLRNLTLQVYERAEQIARRQGHHPGRHQARVRHPPRRHGGAGRRGADPRLVPVLGRRQLVARPTPAVVRQGHRPRLAHLARERVGPYDGPAAAPAARRGRGADPGPLRRGLRAADRPHVLSDAWKGVCLL